MLWTACNSQIISPHRRCAGERRGAFRFVINSIASLCRKVAAGRDGYSLMKLTYAVEYF